MYNQIFEIVYYGNGGFHFYEVYKLPIHLRNFIYKKIAEAKEKEKQEIENAKGKGKQSTKTPITKPNIPNTPKKPKALGTYTPKTK